MGACSSSSQRESVRLEHPQHAPMWVLAVEHVLGMRGTLQSHQALQAQGLIVKWALGMLTIFVSHQWLGRHHPDPDGKRLQVLQGLLKNLMAKKLRIETDLVSQFHGLRVTEEGLGDVAEGYVWLDYFCVPQLSDGLAGPEVADEQLLYIESIPSYVDLCQVFLALVPKAVHHDTGASCSFQSWLERGWCRTELWCRNLSTKSQLPIVVVNSDDEAHFTSPQWHQYPVHTGLFAVEEDRVACSLVVHRTLNKYISDLNFPETKVTYRLYTSLFEEITGLASKRRSLETFLQELDFAEPVEQHAGLGPVACAALAGDHELIRSLVNAKASVQTRAPEIPEVFNIADLTPLHLALWFRSPDLKVLETLLELRADPNSSTATAAPPLGFSRTVAALELLVQQKADVNYQGELVPQYCPIHIVSAFGAPSEVLTRLLQLRADVRGGRGGNASASPLHLVALSGGSCNDLRNARLLLEARADMNQRCEPEGLMRLLEVIARGLSPLMMGRAPGIVSFCSDMSATPLGWCAFLDNEPLLSFLLRARASVELRNHRGLRPLDMASSTRIAALLREPDDKR